MQNNKVDNNSFPANEELQVENLDKEESNEIISSN